VNRNKLHRNNRDELLIAGILKHVGKNGSLIVAGKKYRVADIIALLQSRIDASQAVNDARAVWLAQVDAEKARIEETSDFVFSLRQCLAGTYGSSVEVLADFGLPRRKRRAMTVEEKATALAKGKATRKARRTMGKRQREQVRGNAVDDGANGTGAPAASLNGASNVTTPTATPVAENA
jgi:hypothetical protein